MNAMPAETDSAPKKRGRRSETPLQRLKRLEQEMAAARAAVEETDKLRLATIGSAVIAEAESNSVFMDQLRSILRNRVTTKGGKIAVASLLQSA